MFKLHISLIYECLNWTLAAGLERRIPPLLNKCYTRMLSLAYSEHKTDSNDVLQQVSILAVNQDLFVNRQVSQVFMVRPYLPARDVAPNQTIGNRLLVVVVEEDRVNHGRTTQCLAKTLN